MATGRSAVKPGPRKAVPAPPSRAASQGRPLPTAEPENGKRAKVTKPLIDFNTVEVTDAPEGTQGVTRSVLDDAPIVLTWVQSSWDARTQREIKRGDETRTMEMGASKSVTVPEHAKAQTVSLLRLAAARIGCGIRIVPQDAVDSRVTIAFAAKSKREVKATK